MPKDTPKDAPPKDNTKFDVKPSKPIDKDKDKDKEKKDKLKNAKHLERVSVPAVGSITAGIWTTEMDSQTLRKNTLRGS